MKCFLGIFPQFCVREFDRVSKTSREGNLTNDSKFVARIEEKDLKSNFCEAFRNSRLK